MAPELVLQILIDQSGGRSTKGRGFYSVIGTRRKAPAPLSDRLVNGCYHRRPMRVLGIETSCDETGVALYDSDRGAIVAESIYSQVAMHAEYGGVVPELASRDHVRKTVPLLTDMLARAGVELTRHRRRSPTPLVRA